MADLTLTGCTVVDKRLYYTSQFATNIFLYIIQDALQGNLTRVFIKDVIITNNTSTNYIDTFNRVWLESELTDHSTAQSIALRVLNNKLANLPQC